jgi:hypothetical protein
MANFFPRWTNRLPIQLMVGVICTVGVVAALVTYYFTQKYTRVGYQPIQPVPFEHTIHVEQLGLDCRYCHHSVETSSHSSVPPTQTCMSCHSQVQKDNPKLAPVRKSWETNQPIPWVKIHPAPDYVYFNHSIHVSRGVSCVSCHGQVNEMKTVYHAEPQSMGWCLECHRHPQTGVREIDEVYNLNWKPKNAKAKEEMGQKLVDELKIDPPLDCAGCHR